MTPLEILDCVALFLGHTVLGILAIGLVGWVAHSLWEIIKR